MPLEIELPDGTILEAPDGSDPSAVAKAYLSKQPVAPQAKPPSFGQKLLSQAGRDVGLGARSLYNAAVAIPNMVLDVPVAISNLVAGTKYPSASSQQNEIMSRFGLPSPETTTEKVGDLATQLIGGAATGGPINAAASSMAGLKQVPNLAHLSPSMAVLQAAQKEGMVVPPAQVAPRSLGALLEGVGGTLKTGQAAAARNQPIINTLAARAVGVKDEALTQEVLQAIRNQASESYRVIRGVGRVTTDKQFIEQVQNAVQPFRSAAQSFKSLANDQITAMADDIARPSFEADAAVDAIKMLRDKASVAYRAGSNGEGAAYKSMASALEGAIERQLSRMGQAGESTLKSFRDARQLIAKTHTVEDAMRGSNVDIAALARMLKNGVPLTDELRMLGQFNQEFPGAANLTAALKHRPAYSPLDVIAAGSSIAGALATGEPALAIPAALSASRPAARAAALSPFLQRQMMTPVSEKVGPMTPYALGGAPTFAEWLRRR